MYKKKLSGIKGGGRAGEVGETCLAFVALGVATD